MDIKEELLKEHSKSQALTIANYIGDNSNRFAELMALFLQENYRLNQRAAWPVSICVEKNPTLILPYLEVMINLLKKKTHDAVKRNIVRTLQFVKIPNELLGIAADNCFQLLTSSSEPIAVKVFAMTVIANICEKEPDLKQELTLVIEDQLPYASPGFKSRAKKIFKQLAQY